MTVLGTEFYRREQAVDVVRALDSTCNWRAHAAGGEEALGSWKLLW